MSVIFGLYFEDTAGLIDVIQQQTTYEIDYDKSLTAANPDGQAIHIGAGLAFKDIRFILVETLKRYNHISYYKLSSDYFRVPNEFHYKFVVGDDMENIERLKISPIDSVAMIKAVQNAKDKEEFFVYIRSHYEESGFKIWQVHDQQTTAVEPPETQTISTPAGISSRLKLMEHADNSSQPVRYAFGINIQIDSIDEFVNLLPDIQAAYSSWISQRQDNRLFFQLIVKAIPSLHEHIDHQIKKIYEEKSEFGLALRTTDFDVRIEDEQDNTTIQYILKRAHPNAHNSSTDKLNFFASIVARIKHYFFKTDT